MGFLKMMSFNELLEEINITTNGVLVGEHAEKLSEFKVKTVNLSIDSLQSEKFAQITRRSVFEKVWETLERIEKSDLKLKLNVVVQSGVNTDEINDFVELTKDREIEVRFIEEMPFNGVGVRATEAVWDFKAIVDEIKKKHPELVALPVEKSSTSRNFKIKGAKGIVGVIPAYTRTICSDCNRIRITSTGELKNCLFDEGVYSVRDFLRSGVSDKALKQLFVDLVSKKPKDGFAAETNRKKNKNVSESMSSIGG